jgi:hypothetical protein
MGGVVPRHVEDGAGWRQQYAFGGSSANRYRLEVPKSTLCAYSVAVVLQRTLHMRALL